VNRIIRLLLTSFYFILKELEKNINEIKDSISKLYDEESFKNIKYNLHSVCVHEGSATLGHFWTYIWNTEQHKWFKYNDIEVVETNWDELYSNAIGGIRKENERSPSGYFLIYTKENDDFLYKG
jgi:ubiquitin C-terminal hydrolase